MIFRLIEYLKENSIDFCIINGYKDIVNKVDKESDNDLLFKEKDFNNIDDIVDDFSTKNGFYIVQNMHHELLAKNIFLFNPENGEFLNLDLYGELSRKGIAYFEEDEIFSTLCLYQQLPILSPEKEFINYLIKKLDKNALTGDSFSYLRELYIANEQLCDAQIERFFLDNSKEIKEVFKEEKFRFFEKKQTDILKSFYTLKKFDIKKEILNFIRICKRIIKPTGFSIGFLGPDGSGKSTVIDGILEKRLPFRRKDYFHLKPIPTDKSKSTTVEEPHLMPLYSKNKSYIKLFYFIYQYNFGWIKNIAKLKIKSSLVIFDRYFDDMLVDNKRYRYGGSLNFAKFMRNFIPRPDVYFILTADAEVIYKRKQEVEFEELQRQIKKYRELADNKKYFSIDVNKEPDKIVQEIVNIMMKKKGKK